MANNALIDDEEKTELNGSADETLQTARETANDAVAEQTATPAESVPAPAPKPTYTTDEFINHFKNGTDYTQEQLDAMSPEEWASYNKTADEYYKANPTRKMRQQKLHDRLELSDELEKKAQFVVDHTDGDKDFAKDHDEMAYCADFLKNHKTEFADFSDENVAVIKSDIEKKYKEAADRRGTLEKFWDSLVRGHNDNEAMLYKGWMALGLPGSGDMDMERAKALDRQTKLDNIDNPRAVASVRDVKSFPDAIIFGMESAAENGERIVGTALAATAGAILAAPLGAATVGSIAAGAAGGLLLNTGEAVGDQMEEMELDKQMKFSRAAAIGQGIGYSLAESSIGIIPGMSKLWSGALKMAGKEIGKKGMASMLKDVATRGTIRGFAKNLGVETAGQIIEEPFQSGVISRGRRWIQTGSPLRKGESVEDAWLEAADEAAGAAAASLMFGGLGGSTAYANSKRRIGVSDASMGEVKTAADNVMKVLGNEKTFRDMDPLHRMLVTKRMQNDAVLNSVQTITDEDRKILNDENKDIDKYLDDEVESGNDGRKAAANIAKQYLNLLNENYTTISTDAALTKVQQLGITSGITDQGWRETGTMPIKDGTDAITYQHEGTGIQMAHKFKPDGTDDGFVVINAQNRKAPLEPSVFKTQNEAIAYAAKLDILNQVRDKLSESKRQVIEGVFKNMFGERSPHINWVDHIDGNAPAAYNPADNTVSINVDAIDSLGKLYTILGHERSHEDIAEFLLGHAIGPNGAAEDELKTIRENRVALLGGDKVKGAKQAWEQRVFDLSGHPSEEIGVAKSAEELIAEHTSINDILKDIRSFNRSAPSAITRAIVDKIKTKMGMDMGVAPSIITDSDVGEEIEKLVDGNYTGLKVSFEHAPTSEEAPEKGRSINDVMREKYGEAPAPAATAEPATETTVETPTEATASAPVEAAPTAAPTEAAPVAENEDALATYDERVNLDGYTYVADADADEYAKRRPDLERVKSYNGTTLFRVRKDKPAAEAPVTESAPVNKKFNVTVTKDGNTQTVTGIEAPSAEDVKSRLEGAGYAVDSIEEAQSATEAPKPAVETPAVTETKNEPSEAPSAPEAVSAPSEAGVGNDAQRHTLESAFEGEKIVAKSVGEDGVMTVRTEGKVNGKPIYHEHKIGADGNIIVEKPANPVAAEPVKTDPVPTSDDKPTKVDKADNGLQSEPIAELTTSQKNTIEKKRKFFHNRRGVFNAETLYSKDGKSVVIRVSFESGGTVDRTFDLAKMDSRQNRIDEAIERMNEEVAEEDPLAISGEDEAWGATEAVPRDKSLRKVKVGDTIKNVDLEASNVLNIVKDSDDRRLNSENWIVDRISDNGRLVVVKPAKSDAKVAADSIPNPLRHNVGKSDRTEIKKSMTSANFLKWAKEMLTDERHFSSTLLDMIEDVETVAKNPESYITDIVSYRKNGIAGEIETLLKKARSRHTDLVIANKTRIADSAVKGDMPESERTEMLKWWMANAPTADTSNIRAIIGENGRLSPIVGKVPDVKWIRNPANQKVRVAWKNGDIGSIDANDILGVEETKGVYEYVGKDDPQAAFLARVLFGKTPKEVAADANSGLTGGSIDNLYVEKFAPELGIDSEAAWDKGVDDGEFVDSLLDEYGKIVSAWKQNKQGRNIYEEERKESQRKADIEEYGFDPEERALEEDARNAAYEISDEELAYLRDEAEKFIPDSWDEKTGERMFKTPSDRIAFVENAFHKSGLDVMFKTARTQEEEDAELRRYGKMIHDDPNGENGEDWNYAISKFFHLFYLGESLMGGMPNRIRTVLKGRVSDSDVEEIATGAWDRFYQYCKTHKDAFEREAPTTVMINDVGYAINDYFKHGISLGHNGWSRIETTLDEDAQMPDGGYAPKGAVLKDDGAHSDPTSRISLGESDSTLNEDQVEAVKDLIYTEKWLSKDRRKLLNAIITARIKINQLHGITINQLLGKMRSDAYVNDVYRIAAAILEKPVGIVEYEFNKLHDDMSRHLRPNGAKELLMVDGSALDYTDDELVRVMIENGDEDMAGVVSASNAGRTKREVADFYDKTVADVNTLASNAEKKYGWHNHFNDDKNQTKMDLGEEKSASEKEIRDYIRGRKTMGLSDANIVSSVQQKYGLGKLEAENAVSKAISSLTRKRANNDNIQPDLFVQTGKVEKKEHLRYRDQQHLIRDAIDKGLSDDAIVKMIGDDWTLDENAVRAEAKKIRDAKKEKANEAAQKAHDKAAALEAKKKAEEEYLAGLKRGTVSEVSGIRVNAEDDGKVRVPKEWDRDDKTRLAYRKIANAVKHGIGRDKTLDSVLNAVGSDIRRDDAERLYDSLYREGRANYAGDIYSMVASGLGDEDIVEAAKKKYGVSEAVVKREIATSKDRLAAGVRSENIDKANQKNVLDLSSLAVSEDHDYSDKEEQDKKQREKERAQGDVNTVKTLMEFANGDKAWVMKELRKRGLSESKIGDMMGRYAVQSGKFGVGELAGDVVSAGRGSANFLGSLSLSETDAKKVEHKYADKVMDDANGDVALAMHKMRADGYTQAKTESMLREWGKRHMKPVNLSAVKEAEKAKKEDQATFDDLFGDMMKKTQVTPEMDAAYADAVKRGDKETALRMIREAAAKAMPNTKVVDKDGLPMVVYHGAVRGGFNVFDVHATEDANGNFFSNSRGVASRYGGSETYIPGRVLSSVAKACLETNTEESLLRGWCEINDWPPSKIEKVNRWGKDGYAIVQIDKFNGISYFNKTKDGILDNLRKNIKREIERLKDEEKDKRRPMVYQCFLNIQNPLVVDANGGDDNSFQYGGERYTVETLHKLSRNRGYDGTIVENVIEYGTTFRSIDFVIDNPSQIKSADITYDDAGNLIPLSKRFNPNNDSIMYKTSASASDLDYVLGTRESFEAQGIAQPKNVVRLSKKDIELDRIADVRIKDPTYREELVSRAYNQEPMNDEEVRSLFLVVRDQLAGLVEQRRGMNAQNGRLMAETEENAMKALERVALAYQRSTSQAGAALRQAQRGASLDAIRDLNVYMLIEAKARMAKLGIEGDVPQGAKDMIEKQANELAKKNGEIAEANRKIAELIEKADKIAAELEIERARGGEAHPFRMSAETAKKFGEMTGITFDAESLDADEALASEYGVMSGEAMSKSGDGSSNASVLNDSKRQAFATLVTKANGNFDTVAFFVEKRYGAKAAADFAEFRSEIEKPTLVLTSETARENEKKRRIKTHRDKFAKRKRTVNEIPDGATLEEMKERLARDLKSTKEAQKDYADNPSERDKALGRYLRRFMEVLVAENQKLTNDEVMGRVLEEARKVAPDSDFTDQDIARILAKAQGFDAATRAEIDKRLTVLKKAMRVAREGKLEEAAKIAGISLRTEAQMLEEIENQLKADLDRLNREKDEIYANPLPDEKEQVERIKELRERVKESIDMLRSIKDSRKADEKKDAYIAILEKRAKKMADAILLAKEQIKMLDALSPDAERARQRLARLEAEKAYLTKEMRDARREVNLLRSLQRQIDEFQRKLDDRDFETPSKKIKPRIEGYGEVVQKKMRERDDMRKRFKNQRDSYQYKKLSIPVQFTKSIFMTLGEMKALVGSLDLSSMFRQGGQLTWAHPLMFGRNLVKTLKILTSEEKAREMMLAIERRPNFKYYEQAGMEFTDWNEGSANTDDRFVFKYYSKLTNNKPVRKMINCSERAFNMYLNLMRADVFDALVASSTYGDASKMSRSQLEAIGYFINVGSQRAHFTQSEFDRNMRKAIPTLNTVLWSPRNIWSRIQFIQNTGSLLLSYLGLGTNPYGDKTMRNLFAKELIRYFGGVATAIVFTKLMADMLRPSDEPPEDVVLDPRSSDFLKVKIGNTRCDFLSGLQQILVFTFRSFSGKTKRINGDLKDVNARELLGGFIRSKFSPGMGIVYDLAFNHQQSFERQDITLSNPISENKEEIGAVRYLAKNVFPLTIKDLWEQADQNGMPRALVTWLYTVVGIGAQTYDPNTYKQLSGDYRFYKRQYLEAKDDAERERLKKYHPMLEHMGDIEPCLKEVNRIKNEIRKREKAGIDKEKYADLVELYEKAQKRAINHLMCVKNPDSIE